MTRRRIPSVILLVVSSSGQIGVAAEAPQPYVAIRIHDPRNTRSEVKNILVYQPPLFELYPTAINDTGFFHPDISTAFMTTEDSSQYLERRAVAKHGVAFKR